jgi:UPF0755 protein
MTRWLVVATLIGGLLGGGLAIRAGQLLEPASETARPTLFTIERGATTKAVAHRLEEAGIVQSALALRWLARWRGLDARLHVGEYELSPDQSPDEILEIVTTGRVKTWPVTVPEGSRIEDIARRLEEAGLVEGSAFEAAATDPGLTAELGVPGDSLEGYLFPDTYQLPRGLEAAEVARTMVRQFEHVWETDIAPRAGDSPLSKNEIVTLASIVEKETAAPEERPLIASVFLNRLERGMRLETDPTVIYGIEEFDGNLRRIHLRDASNPYNTYRITGLPPGPISSPGAEALRAVVEPSDSDFLYFVSRNDGTHVFSTTYREHVAAVDRYQRRGGARATRSAP